MPREFGAGCLPALLPWQSWLSPKLSLAQSQNWGLNWTLLCVVPRARRVCCPCDRSPLCSELNPKCWNADHVLRAGVYFSWGLFLLAKAALLVSSRLRRCFFPNVVAFCACLELPLRWHQVVKL